MPESKPRRYGIPYQGSKSRIAEWVTDLLPSGDCLVDIMAGGCAVTHAAMLSGKWGRFIANDIGDGPQIFKDAINGEYEGFSEVATREGFFASDDPAVRLLYSFGNNQHSYLWRPEVEAVKVPAEKMLSAPSLHERRMYYKKFIRALSHYLKSKNDAGELGRLESLEPLQRLERLERLEGLEGLEGLERLEVSRKDYRDVEIPDGAVVYADPPYRNCANGVRYTASPFNFDAFDRWLASVDFPVFVSEYDAPAGCTEIASIEKTTSMSAYTTPKRVEKLFVQDRFARRTA